MALGISPCNGQTRVPLNTAFAGDVLSPADDAFRNPDAGLPCSRGLPLILPHEPTMPSSPTSETVRAVLRHWCVAFALAGSPIVSSAAGAQLPGREQTVDQQVHHALNRLAFGPRPGDVERVRAMSVDAWITQQLHPERIVDTTTAQWLARFETLTLSGDALYAKYPPPGLQLARLAVRSNRTPGMPPAPPPGQLPTLSTTDSMMIARSARDGIRLTAEVMTARVGRAVASERQLLEVMTDFWANHFSVYARKQQVRYYLPAYDSVLRTHALGSFRALLGAVAKSPAMLMYLDQAQSVADRGRRTLAPSRSNRQARLSPAQRRRMESRLTPEQRQRLENVQARQPRGINENYARELLELHTLGVDGGYSQQDVMEVARALTGWTLTRGPQRGGEFVFRSDVHDAEAKIILGESFPAGHGQDEGERLLDLLASHPSTARFIATKLARRFVSDEPPADLVDRAAATFTRTNGDIREVVRTIVTSDEFFANAAFRSKIKSPFELVVSASRTLGGQPDVTPLSAQVIARLGQPIYGRQTPDGWPDVAEEWINTGAILNRMNFGLAVGANRLPGAPVRRWPAARELFNAPVEQQVDALVRTLFGNIVSTETREVLSMGFNPLLDAAGGVSDSLFRPDNDDAAGLMPPPTPAGNRRAGGGRRDLMTSLPELTGFPKLLGLAIGAPEFQRR